MLLKIVASCGFSGWHILQSVVWEGLDVITALHSTIRGKKRAKGNNKWKTKSSETSSIFHPARPHHPLETWRIKHMPIASKTSKAFIYFVLSWKSEGLCISRFQVQAGWKDDRMKEWQDEVPKVWHLKLCWPTHRVNSLTFQTVKRDNILWFGFPFSVHIQMSDCLPRDLGYKKSLSWTTFVRTFVAPCLFMTSATPPRCCISPSLQIQGLFPVFSNTYDVVLNLASYCETEKDSSNAKYRWILTQGTLTDFQTNKGNHSWRNRP